MRQIFLFTLAGIFLSAEISCKKQAVNDSVLKPGEYILNGCENKNSNQSNDVEICFTRLITDCRCPLDVECIWGGYAQCEFSIKKNNQTTIFKLSTLNNTQLQNNTEIYGVKIKLEDVLPYPVFTNPSTGPIKAVLKIEE